MSYEAFSNNFAWNGGRLLLPGAERIGRRTL